MEDVIIYGISADQSIAKQVIYEGTLNEANDPIWTICDLPIEDWVYAIEIHVNNATVYKCHLTIQE